MIAKQVVMHLELEQRSVELRLSSRRAALRNVAELTRAIAFLEQLRRAEIEAARESIEWYDDDRPSWSQIGAALGVTKQAAQRRYGRSG